MYLMNTFKNLRTKFILDKYLFPGIPHPHITKNSTACPCEHTLRLLSFFSHNIEYPHRVTTLELLLP